MEDRITSLKAVAHLIQYAEISMIVSIKEFEIELDRLAAIKNAANRSENFEVLLGNVIILSDCFVELAEQLFTIRRDYI